MFEWIKKRLKSKTHWFNIIVGTLGILEANFGLLRAQLGDHYGAAFIAVAVVGFMLREATKEPVEAK